MGHWLSKKEYAKRAKRIVELRDKKGLQFSEIAERMGISESIVGRCYHQAKGKK